MALSNPYSPPTVNPSLDIFNVAATNISESSGHFLSFFPLSDPTNENSPVELFVPSTDLYYVDLSKTRIFVTIKITKGTGNLKYTSSSDEDLVDPTKTDIVTFVNNGIHSIFSSIEFFLQDILVTQPTTHSYPYIAYLTKLLNNSASVRRGKDTEAGFFLDTDFTSVVKNKGFLERLKLSANSQSVELCDTLDLSFFKTSKYLANAVDCRFRFNRAHPNFCLQKLDSDTNNNYKINITKMKLMIRKVLPDTSILTAHNQLLKTTTAKFEWDRPIFRHFNVSSGNNIHVLENIFNGLIPDKIYMMLLSTENFTGSLKTNPFHFEHKNLSHISLFADQTPLLDLDLNFSNGNYLEAFSNFWFHTGFSAPNKGNLEFTREDFKDGFCIFSFDTSPDLNNNCYMNLAKTGNLRLTLTFSTNLTEATTIIVIGTFPQLIQVDHERKVYHDFKL